MLLWSLPPRSSGSSQVCLTVIFDFQLVVALDFGLRKGGLQGWMQQLCPGLFDDLQFFAAQERNPLHATGSRSINPIYLRLLRLGKLARALRMVTMSPLVL